MPIQFALDADLHGVRAHMTGTVPMPEVIAFVEQLASMVLLHLPVPYDARRAKFPWAIADLRHLKAVLGPLRDEHGAAAVALVTPNDLHFDMGRMYAALAQDHNPHFAVFRTMAEGEAWLQSLQPPQGGPFGEGAHVN